MSLDPEKHPSSVSLPRGNIGDCADLLKKLAKKLPILDCKEARSLYYSLKGKRKLTKELCSKLEIDPSIEEILNKKQRNEQQNDEECRQLKSEIMRKISGLLRSIY